MVKSFVSFSLTSSGTSNTAASFTRSPYPNESPFKFVITPLEAFKVAASTFHFTAAAFTNICFAVAPVCLKASQPKRID